MEGFTVSVIGRQRGAQLSGTCVFTVRVNAPCSLHPLDRHYRKGFDTSLLCLPHVTLLSGFHAKTGQWGDNSVLPQTFKHLSQCCWINLVLYQTKEAPT